MTFFLNAISVKKNSGGNFQIALNFILESLSNEYSTKWIYLLSEDLYDFLKNESKIKEKDFYVFPTQPEFCSSYWSVRKKIKFIEQQYKPALIYTLAAPSYFKFSGVEVMRFTNPWVTHPNKWAKKAAGIKTTIRQYLHVFNQKRLIRKRTFFITQTEQCKKGIIKITGVSDRNIAVIPNVLPLKYQLFNLPMIKENNNCINIITVSAAVPHKNVDIIPSIIDILSKKYNIKNVKFHITIPENTPFYNKIYNKAKELGVNDKIINHGYCTQEKLANLYKSMDLCFIPTLLEVFSASLLEAMYFKLPIIATDFEFNRDVSLNSALYYKPMDENDASSKIAQLVNDKNLQKELISRSSKIIINYLDYKKHYMQTVDFLEYVAKSK